MALNIVKYAYRGTPINSGLRMQLIYNDLCPFKIGFLKVYGWSSHFAFSPSWCLIFIGRNQNLFWDFSFLLFVIFIILCLYVLNIGIQFALLLICHELPLIRNLAHSLQFLSSISCIIQLKSHCTCYEFESYISYI